MREIGYELDEKATVKRLFEAKEGQSVSPVFSINREKFDRFAKAFSKLVYMPPKDDRLIPIYQDEKTRIYQGARYKKGVDGRKLDEDAFFEALKEFSGRHMKVPVETLSRRTLDPMMAEKSLERVAEITFVAEPISFLKDEAQRERLLRVVEQNTETFLKAIDQAYMSPFGEFRLDNYLLTEKEQEEHAYSRRLVKFQRGIEQRKEGFQEVQGAGLGVGLSQLYTLLLERNVLPYDVSHFTYYDPIYPLARDVAYDEEHDFVLHSQSRSPYLIRTHSDEGSEGQRVFHIVLYGIPIDQEKAAISTEVTQKFPAEGGQEGMKVLLKSNVGGKMRTVDEVIYQPLKKDSVEGGSILWNN